MHSLNLKKTSQWLENVQTASKCVAPAPSLRYK